MSKRISEIATMPIDEKARLLIINCKITPLDSKRPMVSVLKNCIELNCKLRGKGLATKEQTKICDCGFMSGKYETAAINYTLATKATSIGAPLKPLRRRKE